jgi:hypothetical protein
LILARQSIKLGDDELGFVLLAGGYGRRQLRSALPALDFDKFLHQ